jgi:protocatechuate 3,4-dioxygenase beta subunit
VTEPETFQLITRRRMLQLGLALPAGLIVACSSDPVAPSAQSSTPAPTGSATPSPTGVTTLPPTPACVDGDDETPAQTEGPYFTPSSPERASLVESGMAGTRLTLTGTVVTTACRPIQRALVDFWQADDGGEYDNDGFRLRGHQFSDAQGRYSLSTIVPGLYPGRTRHIHVKVQPPGGQILTTQLYFPGEAGNASDNIYRRALEMDVSNAGSAKAAAFMFALDA